MANVSVYSSTVWVFVHVRGERVGAGLIVERVGGAGADQRCHPGYGQAGREKLGLGID